jgi:hypothetical protein
MRQLLGIVALAFLFLAPASPGQAQSGNPAMAGSYVFRPSASDNVAEVINVAVARMNFVTRPIARGRLRRTNQPYQRIVIGFGNGQVSIAVDRRSPIVTPANGTPVDWAREDGERLKVSTEWANGRLEQTFEAEDGRRINAYSLSPDGRTLTLSVTLTSPRLARPITYKLVYDRAG